MSDNLLITHYNLLLACLLVNNLVPLCYQEVILCQGGVKIFFIEL
jgi:hypothetical protein